MMIVLDCSAAVEIVRETTLGKSFRQLMLNEETVIAPALFRAEVVNAYWKYVNAGLLSFDIARSYVAKTIELVDEFYGLDDMIDEVFAEAVSTRHSAYDLFYSVLARRHGATLFTVDQRLIDLCNQLHVNCAEEIDF